MNHNLALGMGVFSLNCFCLYGNADHQICVVGDDIGRASSTQSPRNKAAHSFRDCLSGGNLMDLCDLMRVLRVGLFSRELGLVRGK